MPLFHASFAWLEPGSVIRPGNYGRVIELTGPSHGHWHRESVLEQVRAAHFPHKPSRLLSAFALDNRRTAEFYMRHQCRTGKLYEVEAVAENVTWHAADFNLVQPLPRRPETMEQIAKLYWNGNERIQIQGEPGLVCTELLAETGLRVLREI